MNSLFILNSLTTPGIGLIFWTTLVFLMLIFLLGKYAWKPILLGLEQREESIKKSLEEADRIKEELAKIQQTQDQILTAAHQKSKEIIDQSRKAALEAAKHIEQKAREDTQILLENAHREIKDETEKAQVILREESVRIAIKLTEKFLEEHINEEKAHQLAGEIIKKL